MPVGENDLGAVSETTRDLLSEIKELQRELNTVNSQIDRAKQKNVELSPELEKKRKDLEVLFSNAKNQILQSSSRALLNPQVSKEVQSEAKKVIDRELKEIQTKMARTILSGGRLDQALIGQQSQLQAILNGYESRGQTQGNVAAYYQATRERLARGMGGPGRSDNVLQEAFVTRRKIRDVRGLYNDLSTGNIDISTLMDAQDTLELAGTVLKWAGNGASAVGATKVGAWMLGKGAAVDALAANVAGSMAPIAAGMAVTAVLNAPALAAIYDINATNASRKRAEAAADKLNMSPQQIAQAMRYTEPLTPMSVRNRMSETDRETFNLIAKLAGNEGYDANSFWSNRFTLTPGLATEKARQDATVHLAKIMGDFQKAGYSVYSGVVGGYTNKLNAGSMESVHESMLTAAGSNPYILESIQKDLAKADQIEQDQAQVNARMTRQEKWKARYQERAMAELEKETLLSAQDWSRR